VSVHRVGSNVEKIILLTATERRIIKAPSIVTSPADGFDKVKAISYYSRTNDHSFIIE